ncbi:NAD(P)-dependent oxidoreductase [Ramlibacter sp. AW1]|uniref:NAD(P)-dependent oxidoreductase n=1 Tax=Ramlibacter aurantiacus TaxID=2801330 RepID=A0A937D7V6_9BURK|nr:NAD(P)-dependent oxidoreductase [Ramlibacter aurantiacus]
MTVTEIRSVGIVGLGSMGRPIARHIARRGFQTAGYEVDAATAQRASGEGIALAASAAELAAASDLIVVLVGFDAEVEAVILGEGGVLSRIRPGSIIAVCSTVAPQTMNALAHEVQREGVHLVDAPLTRGEEAAESGKLLVMVGGESHAVERCRPVFSAFADPVCHLGALGAGQIGKLVNNLILWACMSANYEGLKLASALGVEPEALRRVLVQSSASNWSLQTRADEKPVPWAEKDMTIVLKEADLAHVSLPLCGVVKEVIKGFKIERGLPLLGI